MSAARIRLPKLADRRADRPRAGTGCPGGARRSCCSPCSRFVIWYPTHARPLLAERAVLPGRRVHPPGPRPEHRRRPDRPARPRLRRVLRGRRLHHGQAHGRRRRRSPRGRCCSSRSSSRWPPGVTLGAPTLRLRGDYLAIVTLGFGEIVRITAQNSAQPRRGTRHHRHPPPVAARPASSSAPSRCPTTTSRSSRSSSPSSLVARLKRSRVGRAWAAIREDEDAAELMGVPTFKMKLWSFAMGASTGGLGGWIYASKVGFINPDTFPFNLSILILAAVVLGGLGSTPGVIAGAFAVGFLPEYLREAARRRRPARLPQRRHRRRAPATSPSTASSSSASRSC